MDPEEEARLIDLLIEARIADNAFQAAYIVQGLELGSLPGDEARIERAKLYRRWRHAGERPKVAYLLAIKGETPADLFQELKE